MNAGLRRGIAHDTDRLSRAFARTRVGLRSLSAHRQTPQVPDTAIAFDALEPFQIHADFPPQIAFDDVLAVLDGVDDLRELLLRQILGADSRINARPREDL